MKNTKNIGSYLTRGALVAAVAGLAAFASSSVAQEKGAERLVRLPRLSTAADLQTVRTGDTIVMSCPKCKDTWAKVVLPGGKGGRQETAVVQRHECPGCNTKIVTEGAGKQAKEVVKHVCKNCGSEEATCCVMKKAGSMTPGMKDHNSHQH